jgi:hypothetical protein
MRSIVGVALAIVFAAAVTVWVRSSSNHVKSAAPAAEASSIPILPLDLMRKSDKELEDKTVREPF